ncbi:MAG: hypothetical protein KDI42_11270 [Gammaproteobacteria bacterium]|nr:hypothetical protein [Gammaproteobacteria bacterium]
MPCRKAYRPWTTLELRLLRQEYGTHGASHVAQQVGRSPKAVQCMAAKMQLVLRRAWDRHDIAQLRATYHEHTDKELAEALVRTEKAVFAMRKKLGFMKQTTAED